MENELFELMRHYVDAVDVVAAGDFAVVDPLMFDLIYFQLIMGLVLRSTRRRYLKRLG